MPRRRIALALMLLPCVIVLGFGLVVPLLLLLFKSVRENLGYGQVGGFSLDAYKTAFSTAVFRKTTVNALWVGAATALISVLLSYPIAYFITFRLRRARNLALLMIVISLFSGYIVRIYAWRTILGANGVINDGLERLGIIHSPLLFLLFSKWALLIVLTNLTVPFTVLIITGAMQ